MREIKFRAWDKATKEMFECSEIIVGLSPACWIQVDGNNRMIVHGETGELMQYTGLKDKNGKEIFERDVVKRVYAFGRGGKVARECINDIVFREDWGAFAFHSKEKIGEGWSRMYGGHKVYPYEIIGNIYENPELSTKGE